MISVWQVNFNNNKHTRLTVVKSRFTSVIQHQKRASHIQLSNLLFLLLPFLLVIILQSPFTVIHSVTHF